MSFIKKTKGANYGLSKPYIAKLETDGSYSTPFKCGKAVETSINPSYSEASLYGDNAQVEYVKTFVNAAVTLGVTELPIQAVSTMFGHSVDSETSEITYAAGDVANYVGYGFIRTEIASSETTYFACFLPKVKFEEGEESYNTKGDSISFNTPTLSGSAMALDNGEWKYIQEFETEAEAEAYIKSKLGME